MWLVTEAQHCPLVRAAYLRVAGRLRKFFSETFLANLNQILMCDLQTPQKGLQVCDSHMSTTLPQKVETFQFAFVTLTQWNI